MGKDKLKTKGSKAGLAVNGQAKPSAPAKKAKSSQPKKLPTPPPPPAESSSSEESGEDESGSSASESEKPAPPKANGKAPAAAAKKAAESDESSDEDSESEREKKPAAKAVNGAKATPVKPTPKDDSSGSSSESESEDEKKPAKPVNGATKAKASSSDEDSEESSDEEEATGAAKPSKNAPKAAVKKAEESNSESGDSSDSSDDEDEDIKMKDVQEKPAANLKRKADNAAVTPAKKAKVDGQTQESEIESATVFVGQLSWNVDNDWLKSEFEQFGTVVGARVATDRDSGKSRGFGHVEFETVEAAKAACARNGTEIDGRSIKVNMATQGKSFGAVAQSPQKGGRDHSGGYKAQNEGSEPTQTLFVGNLPWGITEDQLWETFGEFGAINGVRLPTDRESGKPKGFGYIEYGTVEDARKAYEGASGTQFEGRKINLDYSRPREGGGERGGRGRGGFGGDRGWGGRGGGRGGGGGGRGGFGGGGRGRGAPRGRGGPPARSGAIQESQGRKQKF